MSKSEKEKGRIDSLKSIVDDIEIYAGIMVLGSLYLLNHNTPNNKSYENVEQSYVVENSDEDKFNPFVKYFQPSNDNDNLNVAVDTANLLMDNGFKVNTRYFDGICPGIEINEDFLDDEGYLLGAVGDFEYSFNPDATSEEVQFEVMDGVGNPIVGAVDEDMTDADIAIQSSNLLLDNGYIVNIDYVDSICPSMRVYGVLDENGYILSDVSFENVTSIGDLSK